MIGTISHGLIKSSTSFLQVTLHTSLVFFRLCFHLVETINLLSHFSHVIIVLLPQCCQGTFMGNVGLIKLCFKLSQLNLSLLIEFNLSSSIVTSILKFLSKISNVP